MGITDQLETMRSWGGAAMTRGLPDDVIETFAVHDEALREAIGAAYAIFTELRTEMPEILALDDRSLAALGDPAEAGTSLGPF